MTSSYYTKRFIPFIRLKGLYLAATGLLIILFCLTIHLYYPALFALDDPYIVIHSAQVLHQGGVDPNYANSPALSGNSSLVHLLITYLMLFIVPPIYSLIISNWIGITLYAWGIIYLSKLYQCTTLQTLALLICAIGSGNTLFQLTNGLETALALAAVTWTLVMASQPITGNTRIILLFLLGTLPFIRPELVIFSGCIYFFQLLRYQKKHMLKTILVDIICAFSAALPWLIWLEYNTHYFYPLTASAKNAFFAQHQRSISNRLMILSQQLTEFSIEICPVFLIGFPLLLRQRLGQIVALFIIIFITLFTATIPELLVYNLNRYCYLLIPMLLFGFLINCHSINTFFYYFTNWALAILTLVVLALLPTQFNHTQQLISNYSKLHQALGDWCAKYLPPHQIIIIHDAGYLAYATQLPLVDFVGLKSPENIILHQKYTQASHGELRTQTIARILHNNHAHYLVIAQSWLKFYDTINQLSTLGWQVKLLKKISINDQTDAYEIYFLESPHSKE